MSSSPALIILSPEKTVSGAYNWNGATYLRIYNQNAADSRVTITDGDSSGAAQLAFFTLKAKDDIVIRKQAEEFISCNPSCFVCQVAIGS